MMSLSVEEVTVAVAEHLGTCGPFHKNSYDRF